MNPKQKRIFSISGDNRGLACPFMVIVCQEGNCHQCQIYLDWQKRGEVVVICAWCGDVIRRYPNPDQSALSHGICPKCTKKYFPKVKVLGDGQTGISPGISHRKIGVIKLSPKGLP